MKQQEKPLQGIFSPQGLTTLGASLLAGSGQGAGDAAVIGNAILGTKSYIDQYNDKLNEGALKNATYNLNLANSASDYDYKQKQLGMESQRFGLQQAELGLKLQQAQQEAAINQNINDLIQRANGGILTPQPAPQVTSFNIPADATPEQKQQIIMGMAQQAKQPQMLQGGQQNPQDYANTFMQIGAMYKRPELVTYGKGLLEQQQQTPEFFAQKTQAEAKGRSAGEDLAGFESAVSNMPELLNTVKDLRALAPKATYSLGGRATDYTLKQIGGESEGAAARSQYEGIVANQVLPLLKQTFGSQFTEKEGGRLLNTLGDLNATPLQKQKILDAFVTQQIRNINSKAQRFGYKVPEFNLMQSYEVKDESKPTTPAATQAIEFMGFK